MRSRVQRWQLIAVAVLVCAVAAAAIYILRARPASDSGDLVSLLPAANATVVYIDVAAIRRAGILNMIAGSKAAEEPDYRQFVDKTQFDYQRDLEAVAAAFKDGQVFLALRGRFRWKNLRDYAVEQGGKCQDGYCVTTGSRPDRRISFYQLKRDLMGMAISRDDFAAHQITRQPQKLDLNPPPEPVWALVPAAALQEAGELPAGAKPYVSALREARQVVFTIGAENGHLRLGLDVTCRDAAAAAALQAQLENTTNTLRSWIAREHQQPNPADLSGLLTGGTFRRDEGRVRGQWPIPPELVKAITQAGF